MMLLTFLLPNKYNYIVWLNALFLSLLVIFNWVEPFTVVFAYFLETIIVGLFHIVKLYLVVNNGKVETPRANPQFPPTAIGVILFFMFHFGMFVAIQSIFVFAFFKSSSLDIKEPFYIIQNYKMVVALPGMALVIASIFITNLKYFITNFLLPKKYLDYAVGNIFYKPYVRIFIQQFAVIISGFFFFLFKDGIAIAILLILFRFIIDAFMVGLHDKSKILDAFLRKITANEADFKKAKEQVQQYSE